MLFTAQSSRQDVSGDGNTIQESYGRTVAPSHQYLIRASASVSVLPNQINTHFLKFYFIFFAHCKQLSGPYFPEEKWKWKSLSGVQLFVTPWTKQSLEFSRLEYWNW